MSCIKSLPLLFICLCFFTVTPLLASATTQPENTFSSKEEQLLSLQRQLLILTGQQNTNLIVQTSYVRTTTKANLYSKPGSKKGMMVTKGTEGLVSAGPRLIGKTIWWRIDFNNGKSGWLKENQLVRIPSVSVAVDYDLDGMNDTNARLIGNYDSKLFTTERIDENNYVLISYNGNRAPVVNPRVLATLVDNIKTYSKSSPKNNTFALQWFTEGLPSGGYTSFSIETERTMSFSGSFGDSIEGWKISPNFILGVHYINLAEKFSPDPGEYRVRVLINHCTGYRPNGCSDNEIKTIATSDWLYYTITK